MIGFIFINSFIVKSLNRDPSFFLKISIRGHYGHVAVATYSSIVHIAACASTSCSHMVQYPHLVYAVQYPYSVLRFSIFVTNSLFSIKSSRNISLD